MEIWVYYKVEEEKYGTTQEEENQRKKLYQLSSFERAVKSFTTDNKLYSKCVQHEILTSKDRPKIK